jgi:hypothetical protein
MSLKAGVALLISVFAILCVVIVGAWEWRRLPVSPAPEAPHPIPQASAATNAVSAAPLPGMFSGETAVPSYLELPTCYGMLLSEDGSWVAINGGGRVGYYEGGDSPIYYAWKDVYVPTDQIPLLFAPFINDRPIPVNRGKVVEVDPPVYYMPLPDGLFGPGYYRKDVGFSTFYRWKGVTLKREQVPGDALPKRLLTEKSAEYTIDIEPPKHILAQPELWKKE